MTDKLAVHGPCDRAPQRGLAHAGRADKAEDHALTFAADEVLDGRLFLSLPLALLAQFTHGEELEDTLLDVLEPIVVLVQDLARVGDIQVVFGPPAPGQIDHPVQVGFDDTVFGCDDRHLFHATQLAQRFLFRFLRHAGLFDLPAIVLDLDCLLVLLAQLATDGLELLAKEILALHLFHAALGLFLDLFAQLEHFELPAQDRCQAAQLFFDIVDFQQALRILSVHPPPSRLTHLAGMIVRAAGVFAALFRAAVQFAADEEIGARIATPLPRQGPVARRKRRSAAWKQ